MNSILRFLFVLSLSFPLAVWAQMQSPEAMVRQITADVLAAIQKDDALKAGDRQKALALAEEKVLPHLDFAEMTRLAAGRAWNAANPEQRTRMVAAFRAMLVRTYASAINVYRGQTMQVEAARVQAEASEATVRNRYFSPGKQATPVDYAMRKNADGWQIYDIVVDGVSLVLTYRAQFDEAVRNTGIEGLIKQLQEKTRPVARAG